jgi:enoyl-CoA hydratase/carnithine racemase
MADGTNSSQLLLVEHSKGITSLTLNNPDQYNVLSEEMLASLQHAVDTLDDQTRVLVIKANGKAFCAGHDLKQMRAHPDQSYYNALFNTCSHFMNSLLAIKQPVIAQVQGIATAAGCQLVANCDMAIASEQSRFAVSGINAGLFCSTPSVPLSRNISRKRAFEMLMIGEFIQPATALEWGLINSVVPHENLDEAVTAMANKVISKSAAAVSAGKALFYKQLEMPLQQAYELAADTMACNMMTHDAGEGIDAFKEKRSPVWKHE